MHGFIIAWSNCVFLKRSLREIDDFLFINSVFETFMPLSLKNFKYFLSVFHFTNSIQFINLVFVLVFIIQLLNSSNFSK